MKINTLKIIDVALSMATGALLSATLGLSTTFTLNFFQCMVGWKILDMCTRMYGTYTYNKWLENQITTTDTK